MSMSRRLATSGITVHVRVDGAGPQLLFLGGTSFELSIRAPVFDSDLIQYFTVVAGDHRGLGQTAISTRSITCARSIMHNCAPALLSRSWIAGSQIMLFATGNKVMH